MARKETMMKLKVDLHCQKCLKKVRKVLGKFPEIRDQVFDEKQNLVIIKVICCNPEKIRDKICCKSEGSIKTIEIVELQKQQGKKKQGQQSNQKPQNEQDANKKEKLSLNSESPTREEPNKRKGNRHVTFRDPLEEVLGPDPDVVEHTTTPPVKLSPPPPSVVVGYPPLFAVPIGPWYEGRSGEPCLCFHGYGRPAACYCGCYYGRPVYDRYGGGKACNVSPCEQSASGCTTM